MKQRLNLDGVHIDIREEPWRLDLTFRGWLPICPAFFKIDLERHEEETEDFQTLPRAGLHGHEDMDEGELV